MAAQLASTKSLVGMRAVTEAKGKKIGKVRRFVFHPSEKRVIGILIKRPDAALMFHRKDQFAALNGFHVEDGQVVVHDDPKATDAAAIKALGVDWESCVIWVGMPVMTQSGDFLGYVDEVNFDSQTGAVHSFTTENGAANDALLGKRAIPGKLVKGFKRGIGQAVAPLGEHAAEDDADSGQTGAILVSDEASNLPAEGGVAAAAGKATAVVGAKAKEGAAKAKTAAETQAERARPAVQKAVKATGEAVESGTFAVGKQLGRATGMFAAFKEEFDKASKGRDGE